MKKFTVAQIEMYYASLFLGSPISSLHRSTFYREYSTLTKDIEDKDRARKIEKEIKEISKNLEKIEQALKRAKDQRDLYFKSKNQARLF